MEHEAGTALVASMDAFAVETMDGGLLASGSASIMCLSCHDGAAASEVSPLAAIGGPGGSLPGLGEKDHPVGVPMFGGSLGSGAEIRMAGRLHREANGATVGWWLDLEPVPNGRRDRTDAILYTRGAGAAAEPFVECATCHDPHGAPGTKLLRRPRNGASLCQSCHQI
ncbi:MAG TPA: cytochrome c3 family protein [Thermohalobaculum sp.]|nr:cytochrome c3 family protein [Thermohalobaculum sp.]